MDNTQFLTIFKRIYSIYLLVINTTFLTPKKLKGMLKVDFIICNFLNIALFIEKPRKIDLQL